MARQLIQSGSPWEAKIGYCRAVRVGNLVEVSGTVALVDGVHVRADDMYAQTHNILSRVAAVLLEAGSSMNDVVRTRIFTTNISQWEAIARAHSAFFGAIRPATGLYEVRALIGPEYLVEIEFTAVAS